VVSAFRSVKVIKKTERDRTHLIRFGEPESDYLSSRTAAAAVREHSSPSVQHSCSQETKCSQVMLTEPPKHNTMVIA